jgi:hypothetical protein
MGEAEREVGRLVVLAAVGDGAPLDGSVAMAGRAGGAVGDAGEASTGPGTCGEAPLGVVLEDDWDGLRRMTAGRRLFVAAKPAFFFGLVDALELRRWDSGGGSRCAAGSEPGSGSGRADGRFDGADMAAWFRGDDAGLEEEPPVGDSSSSPATGSRRADFHVGVRIRAVLAA